MDGSESIDVYYWPTPNCFKITIMLEELQVPYRIVPIDITAGDQYSSEYSKICPNNKVPVLRDYAPADGRDEAALFESGAILLYLAEKYQRLLPRDIESRSDCMQWLFWQVGGLGPMGGQAHHFRLYAAEKIPYAIDRYTAECQRLYAVMDRRLEDRAYLANEYSIADVACLPWIFRHERQGQQLANFPNLHRWYQELMIRKPVKTGLNVAAELRDDSAFTSDKGRQILFRGVPGSEKQ